MCEIGSESIWRKGPKNYLLSGETARVLAYLRKLSQSIEEDLIVKNQ